MTPRKLRLWVLSWDNFWYDFGAPPFTARTFPG